MCNPLLGPDKGQYLPIRVKKDAETLFEPLTKSDPQFRKAQVQCILVIFGIGSGAAKFVNDKIGGRSIRVAYAQIYYIPTGLKSGLFLPVYLGEKIRR